MSELRPGLELGGRFVLLRHLGEGGLGEVWLAEDRTASERVALKFVASDRQALATEFHRAQAFAPAGAVRMRALHEVDGHVFLSMDFLPGGDLGQLRGRSYRAFLPALVQVARQLAAVHAAGVVHRDVKGGNVLLDAEGRPHLVDFGLSAATGAAGTEVGSPYNLGPQQLRGEPAAPADDLYAFGALLYELLAGQPPFYPEITRDKVLYEPPPPLVPRQPAPERLRRLALRLLAKSAAQRPRSFDEVASELEAAAAEAPDEASAPQATTAGVAALTDEAGRGGAAPGRASATWFIVAAAVAVGIGVLVVLPRATVVGEAGQGAEDAARRAVAELGARLAAEQGAQQALEQATRAGADFAQRFAALERRAAATWGTAAFASARDAGALAQRHFDLGEHAAATAAWQGALARLAALERDAPAAYQAAMQRGQAALAQARLVEAREAFSLAAAIDPANPAPRRELERTTRYDRALVLVDAAAVDERAGRLPAAAARYSEALAIDAAAPGAREALARIGAARSNDAYAAAMAEGLAAQAGGRIEAARTAFTRAARLRPGTSEPGAALAQLEQGQRSNAVASLAARAASAERAEDWAGAVKLYGDLVALEPTLAAATEGRARAGPRADLDARLTALLEHPDRVLSDDGRRTGRRMLDETAAIATAGPRLAAQRARLEQLLAAAGQPVRVAVESDGVTEVVIYRVGRLGAFARRDLELLPGTYTVVGTRAGYRDVRRQVVVQPGSETPAVQVRCEERI